MTNNKELLLVHASMHNVRLGHTVNVMLTPQFYTLKKEALPVKYAYQAKKIAPSLFDGLLEENGEYEYVVFKEEVNDEEHWVFIAYNIEKIADFLESKGIDTDKVAKLFFAQQSLTQFAQAPLGLGENDAMTVIEDIVVVVPRVVLGEENIPSLRFTNGFTPQTSGVKLKSKPTEQSTLMTQTQAFSLAAIFLLFAGMFAVEGSRYDGDVEAEKQEMESIYETHAYLRSSYTRQDAIDKYQTIDKQERLKRDAIKTVSSMIFKGVNLTKLKVDEKKFTSEFKCPDTIVSKRVKSLATKAKDGFLTAKGGTTVTVEGAL
jgi:hypothetical protein